MTLTFYKQSATPNRIDKSGYLSEMGSLSDIKMLKETEFFQPSFELKTNSLVYNSNYLFCDFTSRYYYINSVDNLNGDRIRINCTCDVLYTYKEEILNSAAWVEVASTPETADENFLKQDLPFMQKFETKNIAFPNSPFGGTMEIFTVIA